MQEVVDQCTEEGGMRLLVASIRSADEIAELAVGVRSAAPAQRTAASPALWVRP